jgi:hypothetical protein
MGAALTTLYLMHEKETEAAMGLPEDHNSYSIVAIGFLTGKIRAGASRAAGGGRLPRSVGASLARRMMRSAATDVRSGLPFRYRHFLVHPGQDFE